MKSISLPVAIVAIASVLGGIVGGWVIYGRRNDFAWARRPLPPPPPIATHGRGIANWVDRGLLELAATQLEAEPVSDAGTDFDGGLPASAETITLVEQRDQLYRALSRDLRVPETQLAVIRAIFEGSERMGQGNPQCSVHPMTREQCRANRAAYPRVVDDERICGSPNMVAVYEPKHEEPSQAELCIDQFEFPNIACEYPVVWVRASEAMRLCRALGKRLCDAHEWEGACAGALREPSVEYESWDTRLRAELFHNQRREIVWATGFQPDGRTCATRSWKSAGCLAPSWELCGTNTYPAGAFTQCVSPFGAYDLHGNVAEHMNLPLRESQLGSRGGIGETEMKGSWFAFDGLKPHPDDCRWRARAWHATTLDNDTSHCNYHLGFRCCRDLD